MPLALTHSPGLGWRACFAPRGGGCEVPAAARAAQQTWRVLEAEELSSAWASQQEGVRLP